MSIVCESSSKPSKKKIIMVIVFTIIVVSSLLWFLNQPQSTSISLLLEDGQIASRTYSETCSRFTITLSSQNDEMNVRVTVDGQLVYERDGVFDFHFTQNLGWGMHWVDVVIENPTIFGLGKTIPVSGIITFSYF